MRGRSEIDPGVRSDASEGRGKRCRRGLGEQGGRIGDGRRRLGHLSCYPSLWWKWRIDFLGFTKQVSSKSVTFL